MEHEKCPYCNASMKKYWHRITPGLVKALVKAYEVVSNKGKNKFDKKDLDLTHGEYGNFQKLRFHALIAKYKVNGEWKRGDWLITQRGADFLKGRVSIPVRVQTFRNKITNHDESSVFVKDVIGTTPYFEEEFDYEIAQPKLI